MRTEFIANFSDIVNCFRIARPGLVAKRRWWASNRWAGLVGVIALVCVAQARADSIDVPPTTYISSSSTFLGMDWTCSRDECDLQEYRNGSWSVVDTTRHSTQRSVVNRGPGTYQYRILVCNLSSSFGSTWRSYCFVDTGSTVTAAIKRYPSSSPAASVASTSNTGSFEVSWPSVPYGYGYNVYERVNSGSWTQISSQTNRSITRSKDSGYYDYRIEACAGQCAAPGTSDRITVAITPGMPTSISAPSGVTDGAFTVSWPASSGSVSAYQLDQQTNGGSWSRIHTGTARSKSRALSEGDYRFRVRACKSVSTTTSCSSWRYSSTSTAARPGSPPALTVSASSGTGSYPVSWASVANTSSYTLQEQINGGSWSTAQSNSSLSKSYTGRSDGRYGYQVSSCNRLGCSAYSPTETVDVARDLAPPVSVDAPAGATDGQFSVSWSAVSGSVSQYQLDEQLGSGSWSREYTGSARSWSIDVTVAGSYRYRARACNIVGGFTNCSDWRYSNGVTVAAPSASPALSVPASSANGGYSVSWGAIGNTSRYTLQEKVGSGSWSTVQDNLSRSKPYTGKGNNSYYYRVRACNRLGCSAFSGEQRIDVALPPGVPSTVHIPSGPTDGQFNVSWPAATGSVSEYQLEQSLNGGGWARIQNGTALSRSVTLGTDGSYRFRVRACKTVGSYTNCAGWRTSAEVIAAKPAQAPVLEVPVSSASGNYQMNWSRVENSHDYQLQERPRGGSWTTTTVPGNDDNSQLWDVTGKVNQSFEYRVSACNALGCSDFSLISRIDVVNSPGYPSNLEAYQDDHDGVHLSWALPELEPENTDWVIHYVLFHKFDNGDWELYANDLTVTSVEITSLSQPADSLTFKVKACNTQGEIISCSPYQLVPRPFEKPSGTIALTPLDHSSSGSYELQWQDDLNGVFYYKVKEIGPGGSEELEVSTQSYLFSAKPSGHYSYQVAGCNFMGCSDFSALVEIDVAITPQTPPSLSAPELTDGHFTLSWGQALGEVSFYRVKEGPDPGSLTQVYEGGNRQLPRTGLVAGLYQYEVQACNQVGGDEDGFTSCSGPRTLTGVQVAAPASAPSGLSVPAVNHEGDYSVSWGSVPNTRHYKLEEQLDGGAWQALPDLATTSRGFSDRPEGRYDYRVSACNNVGCSAPSPTGSLQIVFTPGQPGALAGPALNDGDFELTWGAASGNPMYYELRERSGSSGPWALVYDDAEPRHQRTDLDAGDYHYQVSACRQLNGFATCSDSVTLGPLSAAAPGSAPAQITLPAQSGDGSYTLTWDAVPNVRDYRVEQKLDGGAWEPLAGPVQTLQKVFAQTTPGLYQHRVQACNKLGCSAASLAREVQVVFTPAVPVGFTASASPGDGQTQLSWSGLDGFPAAEQVQVQQSKDGGAWSESASLALAGGSWPEAVAEAGEYRYRARACRPVNGQPHCSDWTLSNAVTYQQPETPLISAPSISETGEYTVSWTALAQADEYRLEENQSASSTQANERIYAGESAKTTGSYLYRVQACNLLGCSEYSPAHRVVVTQGAEDAQAGDGSGSSGSGGDGTTIDDLSYTGLYNMPAPTAPEAGAPVGALQGQFRVNEAGAASYNIPLNLPQGTAGVTPQLAFSYNSQGGAGIMGQGWSLSGLSAISRCRQTLAQDGQARAITWSAEDRFCLDGQRLILVQGSTYGAPGSVYRTEIDSFVQVTAKGGSTGQPSHFEVEAKDGSLTRYGHRADARLGSPEGTLTWAQSQFEDSVGNRIDYRYQGDATTGQRIERVDYAYPSSNSSSGPRAQVSFEYSTSTRRDAQTRYVGGYAFGDTRLLETVTVANTTGSGSPVAVRTYKTDYNDPDRPVHLEQVRLQGLEVCSSTGACLPATRFEWPNLAGVSLPDGSTRAQAFAGQSRLPLTLANQGDIILTYQMMDLNGNGLQDLVWVQARQSNPNSQQLYYAKAQADGRYGQAIAVTGGTFDTDLLARAEDDNDSIEQNPNAGRIDLHVLDYNADGRQDLIARQRDAADDEAWDLFLSTPAVGSGWRLVKQTTVSLSFPNEDLRFADLDSDGLSDAFYFDSITRRLNVHYMRKSGVSLTHSRFYRFSELQSYWLSGLPTLEREPDDLDDPFWRLHDLLPSGLGDFDGDGRMDFILEVEIIRTKNVTSVGETQVGSGLKAAVFVHRGSQLVYQSTAPSQGARRSTHRRGVDLNNDGLTDLLYRVNPILGGWRFTLSTGIGWTEPVTLSMLPEDLAVEDLFITDITRDGFPDLVVNRGINGLFSYRWLPRFNQFATASGLFSDPLSLDENDQLMVTDIDGDGWQDYLVFDSADKSWRPVLAEHQGELSPGRITSIEDGLNNRTEIDYQLLTHSGHYSRVSLGEPVSLEPRETCFVPSYSSGGEVCYTYTPQAFDTDAFYQSLNDPFSSLPENNEHLAETVSPVLELYAPLPIVTRVTSSAPSAGNPDDQAAVSYYYDQMKFQAGGRGSLGFRKLTTVDEQSGIVTETRYRQDWPFIGAPLETITRVGTETGEPGPKLSRAENQWGLKTLTTASGGHYYQSYVKKSIEKDYELKSDGVQQGAELTTVETTTEQDDWGNVTTLTVKTTGGGELHKKTTQNNYGAADQQRLGRLSRTEVTTEYGGQIDTRVAEFSYHASGALAGLLQTETAAVGTPVEQTTEHYYDAYGNRAYNETTGADGTRRQSERAQYDQGRYLQTTINALGHITREVVSRNRFGRPTEVLDINGVSTTIGYDAFGREYVRSDATGAWSWTGRKRCDELAGECPTGAEYRVEEQLAGGGKSRTYYDRLQRPIREATLGFGGQWVVQDSRYDIQGRLIEQSTPYFENQSPAGWTTQQYDLLGRVVETTQPDGTLGQSTDYQGLSQTITNALGQTRTETRNRLGELAQVEDAANGTVNYTYDPQGNLIQTLTEAPDADPFTVRLCYDDLGRKVAMHDPDKGGFTGGAEQTCAQVTDNTGGAPDGWWHYQYNGLGDLVEQRDPKGQRRTLSYDALGRKSTRTDYKPGGEVESHSRWYYDTGLNGEPAQGSLGQLTAVVQSTERINESCEADNFCELYLYDDLGRSTTTLTLQPGDDVGYLTGTRYDPIGRPYVQTDALSGLVQGLSGRVNTYNNFGYRVQTRDIASDTLIQQVMARDAWGNVTQAKRGNGLTETFVYDPHFGRLTHQGTDVSNSLSVQDIGYEWDAVGNLTYRHNQSALADGSGHKNLQESFCYDGLNRLIKTHRGSLNGTCNLAPADQDVQYDGLGNITRKADVGSYSYGANAGPHAITQAGGITYSYDANGNQISGDGRNLEYNSFDKPTSITKGDHTTTFDYGPSRGRYKRTDQVNHPDTGAGPIKTTRYIGNVERIQTQGQNEITWRRHLGGAVYTIKTDTNFQPLTGAENNSRHYVYQDHLGSTDVITDHQGTVIQSMSFDAWGQRRNEQDWEAIINADQLAQFDTDITNRGFTGHEQMDEVGLIHMNGRVYDPKLGRFLQADPFIQEADNTQSYNRYSYVINNPLNATDPSGFIFGKIGKAFKSLAGAFTAIVVTAVCQACGPMVIGALSGAVGAAANGGNILQGAAFGALSGAVFGGIGDAFSGTALEGGFAHVGAHALAGGSLSALQGGKFITGFVSAGIAKAANVNRIMGDKITPLARSTRIFTAAIVGGTTSEITGGKFANGATTAALAQAVNGEPGQTKKAVDRITKGLKSGNAVFSIKNINDVLQARDALSAGIDEINSIIKTGSNEQIRGLAEALSMDPGTPAVAVKAIAASRMATVRQNFQTSSLIKLLPETSGLFLVRAQLAPIVSFGFEAVGFANNVLMPRQNVDIKPEEVREFLLRK